LPPSCRGHRELLLDELDDDKLELELLELDNEDDEDDSLLLELDREDEEDELELDELLDPPISKANVKPCNKSNICSLYSDGLYCFNSSVRL